MQASYVRPASFASTKEQTRPKYTWRTSERGRELRINKILLSKRTV